MNEETLKLYMAGAGLGATRSPQWMRGFQLLALNEDDGAVRELLLEDLRARHEHSILEPHPFRTTNPLPREGLDGVIRLGIAEETGSVYGIPVAQLFTHLLIVGRSGGGKTNLLLLMVLQICGQEF